MVYSRRIESLYRVPMAVCGGCDARDGERIRSRGLPRTGLARVCWDLRLSAGWAGCRPTVRRGVEWLAAGPGRG